jgi:hypothetical protein
MTTMATTMMTMTMTVVMMMMRRRRIGRTHRCMHTCTHTQAWTCRHQWADDWELCVPVWLSVCSSVRLLIDRSIRGFMHVYIYISIQMDAYSMCVRVRACVHVRVYSAPNAFNMRFNYTLEACFLWFFMRLWPLWHPLITNDKDIVSYMHTCRAWLNAGFRYLTNDNRPIILIIKKLIIIDGSGRKSQPPQSTCIESIRRLKRGRIREKKTLEQHGRFITPSSRRRSITKPTWNP